MIMQRYICKEYSNNYNQVSSISEFKYYIPIQTSKNLSKAFGSSNFQEYTMFSINDVKVTIDDMVTTDLFVGLIKNIIKSNDNYVVIEKCKFIGLNPSTKCEVYNGGMNDKVVILTSKVQCKCVCVHINNEYHIVYKNYFQVE